MASDTLAKLTQLLGGMSEADLQKMIGKAQRSLDAPRAYPRTKPDLAGDKVLTRGGSGRTGFWQLYDRIVTGKPVSSRPLGVSKPGRKKKDVGSSKYKGVYKSRNEANKRRPYYVQWESIYIGQYESEEHAARAYDAIMHNISGETPNFPDDTPWELEPSPDA